jgi:hypothetical protein
MIHDIFAEMIASCKLAATKTIPKQSRRGAYICIFSNITSLIRSKTLKLCYKLDTEIDFCKDLTAIYNPNSQIVVYLCVVVSKSSSLTMYKQEIIDINSLNVSKQKCHYEIEIIKIPSCQLSCDNCRSSSSKLQCGKCKDASYCCTECQMTDWSIIHRIECQHVAGLKSDLTMHH